MPDSKSEMQAKVSARRDAEKKSRKRQPAPATNSHDEISDNDLRGYLSENRAGDAKLYCRLFRGKTVYVKYWERFLIWGGHHWIEDDFNVAAQNIETLCELYSRLGEHLLEQSETQSDKNKKAAIEKIAEYVERRVNQLRDVPGQDKLLEMIRRIRDPLVVLPKNIDKLHYLKACPNGVIDLRTGELHPGKPEQYLLNAIPTEYDPALLEQDDPCPEVTAFLLRSMDGDTELVNFIWRLLGYGLITERRERIFVIMWGEHGSNGKDTLIKLITHVLGQQLSGDVPVEMFLQTQQTRNSSAPSPDLLALRGMCIAWINEAEEGQKFALAKLKKLTGGGYITARGLHDKLQTTWLQTHLPIMTTNELPKAKADDAAFWTRAILVKWPLSFVDNPEQPYERQAVKDIDHILAAEAKGVLARLVKGCMDYLKNGLQIPDKVRDWTKKQRANWDDLGMFLAEWCEQEAYQEDPENYRTRISAADLHEAFCLWYSKNRSSNPRHAITAKKLSEMLNKKNIPSKRSNGTWRLGLRLNADGAKALDEVRAGR